jgi:hypothetical protein
LKKGISRIPLELARIKEENETQMSSQNFENEDFD